MATIRKINSRAISTNETGFGTNSAYSGGRFYNKDGTPNVEVDGVGFLKKISLYNTLLKMSGIKLFAVILIFYFVINLTFSGIYLALGPGNLGGADNDSTLNNFWEAFFFTAQTVSTVGTDTFILRGFLQIFLQGWNLYSDFLLLPLLLQLFMASLRNRVRILILVIML